MSSRSSPTVLLISDVVLAKSLTACPQLLPVNLAEIQAEPVIHPSKILCCLLHFAEKRTIRQLSPNRIADLSEGMTDLADSGLGI